MPQVPVADIADTGMSVVPYFADGPAVTTDVVLVNMTNERAAGAVSFLGQGSSTSPAQPVEVTCAEKEIAARPPEPSKVNTKRVSFDLYKTGKTIAEIAAERNLAVSTIEGHLAYFIASRELDISEFLTKEQVDETAGFFEERKTESLVEAKAHFGERFLYGQLRMVLELLKAKAV